MDRKIRYPERSQVELRAESLDRMLTPDHAARAVWEWVGTLDLSPWLSRIKSERGSAGAVALDPRVLAALWLLAHLDGVGSARGLASLCEHHTAYRWICGDEPVNYHSLSDFRNSDPAWLERLLVESVASLVCAKVATLTRVAQDGVRVRASAGASSFRREKTLQECLAEAEEQVAALRDDEDGAAPTGASAAAERSARERKGRIEEALANLEELKAANAERNPSKQKDPEELRASTTDPDARKMKMADGGYRPAMNVQFATTVEGGVVVGVAVTNEGVDSRQMEPMLAKIEELHGVRPEEYLVDGGYGNLEAIDRVESSGTSVLTPVREAEKFEKSGRDPYERRAEDTEATARWRARMGTEAAQMAYRDRASTAELVHAQARNRGLQQFRVRGLVKALSSSLWYALAHNFTRLPVWKTVRMK